MAVGLGPALGSWPVKRVSMRRVRTSVGQGMPGSGRLQRRSQRRLV